MFKIDSTISVLQITAASVFVELIIFAVVLYKKDLFRWNTAGFMSWAAFMIYFVLTPLAITYNPLALLWTDYRLQISGGTERGVWILVNILAGIAVFYLIYFRTAYRPITWKLPTAKLTFSAPVVFTFVVFIAFGVYSLLTFRAGLISVAGEKSIVAGRFVGDVTGYQNSGYAFLFVPILVLLITRNRVLNIIGGGLGFVFIVLSLPHSHSRFATVSFVVAIIMLVVHQRAKKWPSPLLILGILLIAVGYQVRGHVTWEYETLPESIVSVAQEIPDNLVGIFSSADTVMLITWYVESYYHETIGGYDYGLRVLNYLLTGWIPYRIFPDKYFLVDWLGAQRTYYDYDYLTNLIWNGPKSSLFGGFYRNGGIIGILLGSMLMGFFCRRMDGMLDQESSPLVRSVGISWLSALWMIWGSGVEWGVMLVGTLAIPAIFITFMLKFFEKND